MDRRLFLSIVAGAVALPRCGRAAPVPPAPYRLRMLNAHTGETFEGCYRDANGPIPRVMNELRVFLRDTHCGATIAMDVAALDFLAAVMAQMNERRAVVLSAYRTPATNAMLARTMFGVAENSQHMYGRALDVHFESRLFPAMEAARAMKRGGVGWYPNSGFIHLDSGPVRNWNLDEGGLGTLLFAGRHIRFTRDGELVLSRSGQPSGRHGGRTIVLRGGRPLTVRQRMLRLRQLARAEYLARHH